MVYRDLWPGIDLEYSGDVQRLKYRFVVHPGADPGLIRMAYRAISSLEVDREGRLEVRCFPDGKVEVWRDGEKKTEHFFPQAVSGRVGLAARKSKTAFDDVQVFDATIVGP